MSQGSAGLCPAACERQGCLWRSFFSSSNFISFDRVRAVLLPSSALCALASAHAARRLVCFNLRAARREKSNDATRTTTTYICNERLLQEEQEDEKNEKNENFAE